MLNCERPGPKNARKHVLWEISKGARIREIGTEAAVWAGPGKYEVSSAVLLMFMPSPVSGHHVRLRNHQGHVCDRACDADQLTSDAYPEPQS